MGGWGAINATSTPDLLSIVVVCQKEGEKKTYVRSKQHQKLVSRYLGRPTARMVMVSKGLSGSNVSIRPAHVPGRQ